MPSIRVLRGLFANGMHQAAGSVILVDPLQAGEVVATGRAEFVDDIGKAETLDAVQKARARLFPLHQERSTFWSRRDLAGL